MNWPTSSPPSDHSSLRQLQTNLEQATQQRTTWVPPDADYPLFASEHLLIRTKSGAIAPLAFNRAQRFIHEKLEAQRAMTGKVRALILKGRQQGCSTYIAGRFYHRATSNRGLRVFILTHEDQATQNLFEIVTRFHDYSPAR